MGKYGKIFQNTVYVIFWPPPTTTIHPENKLFLKYMYFHPRCDGYVGFHNTKQHGFLILIWPNIISTV